MRYGIITMMALAAGMAWGAEARVKSLPPVNKKAGGTLMQALEGRRTSRDFTPGAVLTDQELGDLLWVANGFNRPDRRTSPSALNAQAVDIYVCDREGTWLYDAKGHSLKMVREGDCREATGKQPFVKDAAVNLLFVYDLDRAPQSGDDTWAAFDSSFPVQNVYLYCAGTGLKAVVRGYFDKVGLHRLLGLRKSQRIMLTQSVGR